MPRPGPGFPDGFITPDMVDDMMAMTQERWRQKTESKPLKTGTTLEAALKKQPSLWVEGICHALAMPKMRRVKERIAALCAELPREETLKAAWNSLAEPPRRMLHWMLSHEGGYATVQKLSAKFGRDDDITWWWNEGHTPVTPLGLLRLHGLVYVGRARMGKRNVRVAVVPVELRDGLFGISQDPGAFDGAPPMPEAEEEDDGPGEEELPPGAQLVLMEEFVKNTPFGPETERSYMAALSQVAACPEEWAPGPVQKLLGKIIASGGEDARIAAYGVGALAFGLEFARRALDDPSEKVKRWAEDP